MFLFDFLKKQLDRILVSDIQPTFDYTSSEYNKKRKRFIEQGILVRQLAPNVDDTMYMSSKVEQYLQMFRALEIRPDLYSEFFKIRKVLPISSANGKIFIIRCTGSDIVDSEVIVKVPLSEESDSLLYEYYIGKTLNNLRFDNKTNHFSIIYGKVVCGFDNDEIDNIMFSNMDSTSKQQALEDVKICDRTKQKQFHLIYEYMRSPNTKTVQSFASYIKRLKKLTTRQQSRMIEMNIINILIIVMYTLQIAQDTLQFTHYDLHLDNILVVKLNKPERVHIKYGADDFYITTNVMPYIIDYGRCHINPGKFHLEKDEKIVDEDNKIYSSFQALQEHYFKNDSFLRYDDQTYDSEEIANIEDQIAIYIHKYIYNRRLQGDSDGRLYYFNTDGSKNYDVYNNTNNQVARDLEKMIINRIFNKNTENTDPKYEYNSRGDFYIKQTNMGITPTLFNPKFDFFKIVQHVLDFCCDPVLQLQLTYSNLWNSLRHQLNLEYPFYDSQYYALPCDYHLFDYNKKINPNPYWNFWIKRPVDVGKILYECIKNNIVDSELPITSQIGGRTINKKVKISKDKMTSKTMSSSESRKQNSDLDFIESDEPESIYVKYVESDLLKKLNQNPLPPLYKPEKHKKNLRKIN
jgi:hypothetical protein